MPGCAVNAKITMMCSRQSIVLKAAHWGDGICTGRISHHVDDSVFKADQSTLEVLHSTSGPLLSRWQAPGGAADTVLLCNGHKAT